MKLTKTMQFSDDHYGQDDLTHWQKENPDIEIIDVKIQTVLHPSTKLLVTYKEEIEE